MALHANKLRLGIFFVIIMALFITAIFWLVGGFSSPVSTDYACFFPWTVGGLNVGSSVNYNGVPVGSVTEIGIAQDGRLVKVILQIDDEKFMVDNTIVASLYMTGITGLRNVNLESLPDSISRLNSASQLPFDCDASVIPVKSGTVQSMTSGLQKVLEMLDAVDVEELNDQAILALTTINGVLYDLECDSLGCRLKNTMANIDEVLETYNSLGIELTIAIREVKGDVSPMMDNLETFIDELTDLRVIITYLAEDMENTFDDTDVILHEVSVMLPIINRLLEGFTSSASGEDIW